LLEDFQGASIVNYGAAEIPYTASLSINALSAERAPW
jgi:hypothetical protein